MMMKKNVGAIVNGGSGWAVVPCACLGVFLGLALIEAVAQPALFSGLPVQVGDPAALELESFERVARTLRVLEQREGYQTFRARKCKAFLDFRFHDRREASGITFEHRITPDSGKLWKPVHYDHGNGLAVADVDGDGKLDLYFLSQLGRNELWRNTGNGRFEDWTDRAGVGLEARVSVACAFGDVDNDGDSDLFVTTVRMGNVLFENQGDGRFRDISAAAGVDYRGHSSGACFLDYDNDGLLDLFVANVGRYTTDELRPEGYYLGMEDAFSGHLHPERFERSLLYRNLGGNRFQEVGLEAGLDDRGWSGDASFSDLNRDGFPDLYVPNMQGDDRYFENDQGRGFVDRTAELFPKTPWGAMGIKFFDYDQNGHFDLYITDMHSDMSSKQDELARGFDPQIEKSKSETWCGMQWDDAFLQGPQNNIFGNALFRNSGETPLTEVSETVNAETFWPWGISVGDLNADGFGDVFVTGSMNYPFRYALNSVLINDRGEAFYDAELLLGIEPRPGGRLEKDWMTIDCSGADRDNPLCAGKSGTYTLKGSVGSRTAVIFDLDDDGDLDIVTGEFNDRPQVLLSTLSWVRTPKFVKVKLVGTKSNRDGLGAVVRVVVGARTLTQQHDGKSGYLSQSAMPLYFGLGDASKVTRIEVLWPGGTRQTVSRVRINALNVITQPR